MIYSDIKYSYNDIAIVPDVVSNIKHREECNTLNKDGFLPIFTAPMPNVVDIDNYSTFISNRIHPILPRPNSEDSLKTTLTMLDDGNWVSLSLSEFNTHIINIKRYPKCQMHVLIDSANGHMKSMLEAIKKAKMMYGGMICIMAGNIANPQTYKLYNDAGCDYVRVGIGGGAGCITSTQTGIHYPMASLINDTWEEKKLIHEYNTKNRISNEHLTKIVADGGIRNYSDVIKALALGADYVMIGSVFAQLIDSAAETYWKLKNGEFTSSHYEDRFAPTYKLYYGMASSEGQKYMYGKKKNTAEGIVKYLPTTITIKQWSENMKAYLASAMSYTNIPDIELFNPYSHIRYIVISPGAQSSINK